MRKLNTSNFKQAHKATQKAKKEIKDLEKKLKKFKKLTKLTDNGMTSNKNKKNEEYLNNLQTKLRNAQKKEADSSVRKEIEKGKLHNERKKIKTLNKVDVGVGAAIGAAAAGVGGNEAYKHYKENTENKIDKNDKIDENETENKLEESYNIKQYLLEEGIVDTVKDHFKNNYGKYLAGVGALGAGTIIANGNVPEAISTGIDSAAYGYGRTDGDLQATFNSGVQGLQNGYNEPTDLEKQVIWGRNISNAQNSIQFKSSPSLEDVSNAGKLYAINKTDIQHNLVPTNSIKQDFQDKLQILKDRYATPSK